MWLVSKGYLKAERKLKIPVVTVFQTIPIIFHKSSDSMEVTNLTQILLRTEVYNQNRQNVWGIYFVIEKQNLSERTKAVQREGATIHLFLTYHFW